MTKLDVREMTIQQMKDSLITRSWEENNCNADYKFLHSELNRIMGSYFPAFQKEWGILPPA